MQPTPECRSLAGFGFASLTPHYINNMSLFPTLEIREVRLSLTPEEWEKLERLSEAYGAGVSSTISGLLIMRFEQEKEVQP
jgi:hypothetical protein